MNFIQKFPEYVTWPGKQIKTRMLGQLPEQTPENFVPFWSRLAFYNLASVYLALHFIC